MSSDGSERLRHDLVARVDELTDVFVEISRSALDWFGTALEVGNKAAGGTGTGVAGFDPVTVADRTLEERFRSAILERFPDHSIVGEEAERHDGTVDVEWIIDPIDGTRAFVTGRPMWGSLVGVSVAGFPVLGWMHQPVLGVTHVGSPSGTTQIESGGSSRTVRTRDVTDLADAVLLCTHPGMYRTREERWGFAAVERKVQQSRYDGDCANYGFLAAGFGDLVIERGLAPYDIVPLVPIVEGAGGVVTSVDGGSPLEGGWIVAAANSELHRAALDAIAAGRHDALQVAST